MILIITYDLRSPKDYHDFYEAIKGQGTEGKWWHYMASTWLLSTSKTPQEVVDAIRPKLDPQDFLFVCELNPNYQGWLPKPAWDWLNAELRPQPNYLAIFAEGLAKNQPPPNAFLAGIGGLGGLPGGPPDKKS
jgi:hypothetical protein